MNSMTMDICLFKIFQLVSNVFALHPCDKMLMWRAEVHYVREKTIKPSLLFSLSIMSLDWLLSNCYINQHKNYLYF